MVISFVTLVRFPPSELRVQCNGDPWGRGGVSSRVTDWGTGMEEKEEIVDDPKDFVEKEPEIETSM